MMRLSLLCLTTLLLDVTSAGAQQTQVSRESDIVDLRLGQRVLVDDGACPAGQIKEISGTKLNAAGVVRAARCVPRSGTKK